MSEEGNNTTSGFKTKYTKHGVPFLEERKSEDESSEPVRHSEIRRRRGKRNYYHNVYRRR